MTRTVVLLVVASALVQAPAAPLPKEKPTDPPFYPTKVGTRWIYAIGDVEHTAQVITKVDAKGEETRVTIDFIGKDNSPAPCTTVVESKKGVYRLSSGRTRFDPPFMMLKLPLVPGDKWETHNPAQEKAKEQWYKCVVREPVEIEVPAGKFRAFPVEQELTVQGSVRSIVTTSYWAAGVGLVKVERLSGDSTVLKSFTPGK